MELSTCGSSDVAGVWCSSDDDGAEDAPVGFAGVEQCSDAVVVEVGEAVADAFDALESPWVSRGLGLLDFDQGLVVPFGIVDRGFELCRGGLDQHSCLRRCEE